MGVPVDDLIEYVAKRLHSFGRPSPSPTVVGSLLQIAYFASLRTEEGRFVRPSITFADPQAPDLDAPFRRRADYPAFSAFASSQAITVELVVKLSRAIDQWSGSIAVYGTKKANMVVWGVVDQLVQQNVRLHHETESGFSNPGILTINVDGVGDLSVYHGTIFLGGLRGHRLVLSENDVLRSKEIADRIKPTLAPAASRIASALPAKEDKSLLVEELFAAWANTISRLCIGLRRGGSGGAFLITPTPNWSELNATYKFKYDRLGDSMILRVLDDYYLGQLTERTTIQGYDDLSNDSVSDSFLEIGFAEADASDRESEVTGAAKLVTSLAAVDGLVLLTPALHVVGFGVKISSERKVDRVYDGAGFQRQGLKAKMIDTGGFGTRHNSMLRYCQSDPAAVGVVVSQDGHVRVIMSSQGHMTLWHDVKLLGHTNYSIRVARNECKRRLARRNHPDSDYGLGYTTMPKTLSELLALRAKRR